MPQEPLPNIKPIQLTYQGSLFDAARLIYHGRHPRHLKRTTDEPLKGGRSLQLTIKLERDRIALSKSPTHLHPPGDCTPCSCYANHHGEVSKKVGRLPQILELVIARGGSPRMVDLKTLSPYGKGLINMTASWCYVVDIKPFPVPNDHVSETMDPSSLPRIPT